MTLVLSNDDVDAVLDMPACLVAMEQAYREHAARRAVNRPRTDVYGPHPDRSDAVYVFKSFEGLLPSAGVVALRINSDVIAWTEYAGSIRKDKQPLADGRWVGLVLLFSTRTGEPLAIFPDGVTQRMRVGATNALAARHLARSDARVYGLLGAGWQAGAQLQGIAAIRQLDEVRVYSPNAAHREAFVAEWSEKLGLPMRAVDSAAAAAEGADILGTATNAVKPVVDADWVRPGMHLSCVKRSELGAAVLDRCQRVFVHAHAGAPQNYLVGLGDRMVPAYDPLELVERVRAGQPITEAEAAAAATESAVDHTEPELTDVIAGELPGRTDDQEINTFVNNTGLGMQFAAIGALAYTRARDRGLGRQLPTDWFTENVHP
jgi:ornithine cyclodeaminase/alanine dehydrogenase-like protein (mu-crystallin family)